AVGCNEIEWAARAGEVGRAGRARAGVNVSERDGAVDVAVALPQFRAGPAADLPGGKVGDAVQIDETADARVGDGVVHLEALDRPGPLVAAVALPQVVG